jgi:hypothetical protein
MSTVLKIALGVVIGLLCPPLGIAILIWYYFLRGK